MNNVGLARMFYESAYGRLQPRSDLSFGLPSLWAGSRFRNALDTSLQSAFKNPKSEIRNLKSQGGLPAVIHKTSGLELFPLSIFVN
jgi:hypothetical protein